ncbi:chloramphenicol acetyltransferase [Celeribacter sp.]|uniref:chloramphenicol acetyltransferase n=1 Tax=Celeribacter sp. TaxID=1890673 RepID=UPI003A8DC000
MTKLGLEPLIHEGAQLHAVTCDAYVEIGEGSRILYTHFGAYSYCDRYAEIANARIGKFANIAAFSRIGPTDHPMSQASLHHFLYRSADYWDDAPEDDAFFEQRAARLAHIGHDTWIGHNAVIKPDVTIGHGAVVASSAVVTRDVAPYTIVGGIPAKPIRARFTSETAERLMEMAWWDWDHATLRARLDDFRHLPIEAFVEKYG